MERLISSPLHLTRAPSSSARPRSAAHLLPPAAAHLRGLGFGPRLPPLAPLLLLRRPPPVVAVQALPAEASAHSPVPQEDDDSAAGEDAPAGAARFRRFFQKVAVVAFLASVALALIQPSSVVSPPAAVASALHGHGHGHSAAAAAAARTSIFKSELLGSAWTGFLAGCLHTLSGPDHLAALAPLSIGRSAAESAAVGALWGCGHDAGQVLFGLLFLGLKDRLRLELLRAWGTRVVGLTLLVIGAIGIREATQPAAPAPCVALHDAIGNAHDHSSSSSLEKALLSGGGKKKEISFATFATGIVHGLQPDALMIILPALALPSRLAGAAFLGMFLVGTVLSMASYTVLIGTCTEALRERVPRITEKLTWAASLVAISMGLAIIASESFGVSLF